MPRISHLTVTLPKHTRTADNPIGSGNLRYTQDKQIDLRATQAFMSMLHPGEQYRLKQVVAHKAHINFDTVQGLAARNAEGRIALDAQLAQLDRKIQKLTTAVGDTRIDNSENPIQRAAQQFYDGFHTAKTKALSSLSKQMIFKIESVPRQAIPGALTLQHLQDALSPITLNHKHIAGRTPCHEMSAQTVGILEAISLIAKNRLSKLDIEILALLLTQYADTDTGSPPSSDAQPKTSMETNAPRARFHTLGNYIPASPTGVVLANRLEKQLNVTCYLNDPCPTYHFERLKTIASLKQEKQKCLLVAAQKQRHYPGDLALGAPHANSIDLASFRQSMLQYAEKLAADRACRDGKNIVVSCLAIIDRQMIPGGNPALAADLIRIMHLLQSIEEIKAGSLDIGHYTDADSQSGAAIMYRLSKAKRLKKFNSSEKDIARAAQRADLEASALLQSKALRTKSNKANRKQIKPVPFEHYTTHILSPKKNVIHNALMLGACVNLDHYYSDYDVGAMHISGSPKDTHALNQARDELLSYLKEAACRYEACFKAINPNRFSYRPFSQRDQKLDNNLYIASDRAQNGFLCTPNDALKQPLHNDFASVSLGDLGRSLHNNLTNSLTFADKPGDLPAAEKLVVQPIASTIINNAGRTNPPLSKIEALLYPLKTRTPMAKLRYDFHECFYESSWRNKTHQKHPLTQKVLKRISDKTILQAPRDPKGAPTRPSSSQASLLRSISHHPTLRVSSDSSDIPHYMLNTNNKGL